MVTNEEIIIGETQKHIPISDIKDIKIKRKRESVISFFKYYIYTYKFVITLQDLRTYEFYFKKNNHSKAFKYKTDIDKLIHTKS